MEAIKSYIKGFFCQEEIIYDEIFYNGNSDNCDMMLNCNSFEQLKKDGWTAIFSKDGYNRYLKSFKNEKGEKFEKIVVGIVGMYNRGKSYLLKRILNNKNYGPKDGFLVTRHGLTCGFPDLPIITLELEGKNNPLLQSEYSNSNDIKSIIRDQKVCEILFSDFIIKESNILIAVIEQLNFVEQEMIITLIERLKQKEDDYCEKRRLIVIHNLMDINKPEEIEKYVNNILLQSFFLKKKEYVINPKNPNIRLNIYEQLTSDNRLCIVHLVIGNDDSEGVRKKYNEPAFRYIRDCISITEMSRCFDILDAFKKFIIDNSYKFMRDNYFTENSLEIGEKQLKKVYVDKDRKKPPEEKIIIPIKLKNKIDTINLKSFYFSSDDKHYFSNSIEPLYSTRIIEKNEEHYLEVTFEMFGKLEDLTCNIEYDNDKVIIIEIRGKNKEINIIGNEESIKKEVGNLKYEYFNFQVQINKYIKNKYEIEIIDEKIIKKEDIENGIYTLLFPINLYNI